MRIIKRGSVKHEFRITCGSCGTVYEASLFEDIRTQVGTLVTWLKPNFKPHYYSIRCPHCKSHNGWCYRHEIPRDGYPPIYQDFPLPDNVEDLR